MVKKQKYIQKKIYLVLSGKGNSGKVFMHKIFKEYSVFPQKHMLYSLKAATLLRSSI